MRDGSDSKNTRPGDKAQERPEPHPRDGHLRIPNEVAEALARLRLSGSQAQILWAVLRKTLGWQKLGEWRNEPYPISLTDFNEATGVSRSQALRDIEDLTKRRILNNQPRKGKAPFLSLNLDVTSWKVRKPVSEMTLVSELTPVAEVTLGGVKNDTSTSSRNGTGGVAEMTPPLASTQTRLKKPKQTLNKHTKETGVETTPSKKKTYFFDNILLTEEEYQKLVERCGEAGTKDRLEALSLYKKSKGKRYKDDYATVLAWERREQRMRGGQDGTYRRGDKEYTAEELRKSLE